MNNRLFTFKFFFGCLLFLASFENELQAANCENKIHRKPFIVPTRSSGLFPVLTAFKRSRQKKGNSTIQRQISQSCKHVHFVMSDNQMFFMQSKKKSLEMERYENFSDRIFAVEQDAKHMINQIDDLEKRMTSQMSELAQNLQRLEDQVSKKFQKLHEIIILLTSNFVRNNHQA